MRQGLSCTLGFLGVVAAPLLAVADPEAPRGTLQGRIVDGESLAPIEGATIVVTESRGGPIVVSGTTDGDGKFRYLIPPGTYDLLAIFADARWQHRAVVVEAGKVVQIPGALAVSAEVVTIHEHLPGQKHTAPEALRATIKPILPYSDEAMDQNVWAIGWVLLDVDETGEVTGFRFLHRPGYGLDAIAEREVFLLKFDPARDAAGTPMASKVLWKLEWPAFHYAKDHQLLGLGAQGALISANQEDAKLDHEALFPPGHRVVLGGPLRSNKTVDHPTGVAYESRHANGPGNFVLPGTNVLPCKGKAPMNLDMHEAMYRDCSPPDLSKVNTEPLIPRP